MPRGESRCVEVDGCLAKMARVLYDDHRFEEMPVLADALEEAGCEDAAVLEHCRSHPRHARGCFVVDALLAPQGDFRVEVP